MQARFSVQNAVDGPTRVVEKRARCVIARHSGRVPKGMAAVVQRVCVGGECAAQTGLPPVGPGPVRVAIRDREITAKVVDLRKRAHSAADAYKNGGQSNSLVQCHVSLAFLSEAFWVSR